MKRCLHLQILVFQIFLFSNSLLALPDHNSDRLKLTNPDSSSMRKQEIYPAIDAGNNAKARTSGYSISSGIKPGLRSKVSGMFKDAVFMFNVSANTGSTSSKGIATDRRIIPNIGAQLNWKNFGLGLDAGTFSSETAFDFKSYYDQFGSLGFAVFDHPRDQWKSTFISAGPQYTFHIPTGPGQATEASGLQSAAKTIDILLSLKAGLSINKSPEISIYDSAAPYATIASYKAPDDYKQNVLNIKPGVSLTYWFNDFLGAGINAQYLIVSGQNEFKTAYRDLSNVPFDLDPREVRFMILKSPVTESTITLTKGPGNMFSFGAGVTVRLGLNKKEKGNTAGQSPQGRTDQANNNEPAGANPGADRPSGSETTAKPAKKEKKQEEKREYVRPSILSPADGSSVATAELRSPLVLKWTAVAPPPPGIVVYHVSIFEIAKDQQPAQAIKTNKPVFQQDVSAATQASWSPSGNGSQEIKQYVWTVQATDQAGKPYGANNGTSEPATFSIGQNDIDIAIDSLKVECCQDGKQLIKFTIKNNLPNSNTILKKFIITAVNGNFGLPYPMDISASVSPPLPFSFLPSSASPSSGRMNFTASVSCNLNMNNLIVKAEAERNTPMGMVTDNDLETDTLNCICRECDKVLITIPGNTETLYSTSTVVVTSPVSVSPKKVTRVTAGIVYFSYIPESGECAPCNKDSKTYGNISSAALSAPGFPSVPLIPYGHEASWSSNSPAGSMLNGQFSIKITVPPLVSCCSAKIRFCVRYTFLLDDCTTCEKVVCYTVNKEGCTK